MTARSGPASPLAASGRAVKLLVRPPSPIDATVSVAPIQPWGHPETGTGPHRRGVASIAVRLRATAQTESAAKLWWRTLLVMFGTVVLQAVAPHLTLRIFLDLRRT